MITSNTKTNSLVEITREFYTIQEMADIMFTSVSSLQKRIQREKIVPSSTKWKANLYTYYQFLYLKGEL